MDESAVLYLTVCGIILIISTLAGWTVFWKSRSKRHLPPSPLALPVIGHLHLLGSIPHQSLHNISNKYGPLVHLRFGFAPCVLASTAETAKEFLKTHELSFSNRPFHAALDYLTYGSVDFTSSNYGPYWKFMKKICMSELLGSRQLEQSLPIRREEIRRFLVSMLRKSDTGNSVDVGGELTAMSNNIISRMMMNKRCSDSESEAEGVRKLVHEVAEITEKFNLSDYMTEKFNLRKFFCNLDLQGFKNKLEDIHSRYDNMTEKILQEHEEIRSKKNENDEDRVKDLLDILLDVAEDDKAEIKLTRENIKGFILDIFAGGTDTSAITIEWALAELINHPEIFAKAREEVDVVIGQSRLVEESDIPNLPYIQAIIKETLRLHPTAPLVLRESSEDCKIGDYDIPKKTKLFVNVWAIGRDPNHWENPLEFRPNRFISEEGSGKSQLDVRGQHFHLIPFGSGRRGCPGTTLALQLVQTTLASMIQCFEWKVRNGNNSTIDMNEAPGLLTLARVHPVVCAPIARFNLLPLIQ